jgi:2,3-bisphosphoglycerate-independent phosphoglycerate mutase
MPPRRPVALVILDGWGLRAEREANAVALANTPVFDGLMSRYPHARLRTSGPDVGLPEGQMGNSEVGHLTLGSGTVIEKDLLRINRAAADGSLARMPPLADALAAARAGTNRVHLMGLLGDGGVHAHSEHLKALLRVAREAGIGEVLVHGFTDGRDTAPDSARGFVQDLESFMADEGVGRLATVCGRFFAMDRDQRWERTEEAWRALCEPGNAARSAKDGAAAIEAAYAVGETDEFIRPTQIGTEAVIAASRLAAGDLVILFNYRADRMRQLLAVLIDPEFAAFEPRRPAGLHLLSMTRYLRDQTAPVIFPPQDVAWPLARVLAEAGLRQFHCAETEKYAHVTYFFNGGREAPFAGETHQLVPSPKVSTYDLAPEMSAVPLTDMLVARIDAGTEDFYLVNYANPDMVGHSGDLQAAIRAVECVDRCLGRVIQAMAARGGTTLVTADHGNCELMVDPETGGPHTAHTLNPVPFILVDPDLGRDVSEPAQAAPDGGLRDVAPTVLALLGLPIPDEMSGRPLLGVDRKPL